MASRNSSTDDEVKLSIALSESSSDTDVARAEDKISEGTVEDSTVSTKSSDVVVDTLSASSVSGSLNSEEAVTTEAIPLEKKEIDAGGNPKLSENECSRLSRPALQPKKRRPEKDLNHDNWDEEDEPEEKGEFVKASTDKLKERKILTAKRKQKLASASSSNPFGSINFGNSFGSTSKSVSSMFNFVATQLDPIPVPTFDFSGVSSSTRSDNKIDEPSENDSNSSEKLRRDSVPEDADSATSENTTGGDV